MLIIPIVRVGSGGGAVGMIMCCGGGSDGRGKSSGVGWFNLHKYYDEATQVNGTGLS